MANSAAGGLSKDWNKLRTPFAGAATSKDRLNNLRSMGKNRVLMGGAAAAGGIALGRASKGSDNGK
jgi:hypothetical protein